MAESLKTNVELGFVERVSDNSLVSANFPSKVGGKPAWLNLRELPSTERLTCNQCNHPMIFLLQIYIPSDDDDDRCYHRALFVFMCKTVDCCQPNTADNFVAFRCQLPKINEFYGCDSTTEKKVSETPAADYPELCVVCGCLGSKNCGQCKSASYCSRQHQIIDWKSGHKNICCKNVSSPTDISSYCLPEFEIVIESEELEVSQDRSEEDKIKDFEKFQTSLENQNNFRSDDLNTLEEMATPNSDKQYQKFKKRISHEPEQVLRYEKNGSPLWVTGENIPEEIPNCVCGARRQFEFQILPQLLNYLSLDSISQSIDWGTLAIYTCSENCEIDKDGYRQEFIWKQDFLKIN